MIQIQKGGRLVPVLLLFVLALAVLPLQVARADGPSYTVQASTVDSQYGSFSYTVANSGSFVVLMAAGGFWAFAGAPVLPTGCSQVEFVTDGYIWTSTFIAVCQSQDAGTYSVGPIALTNPSSWDSISFAAYIFSGPEPYQTASIVQDGPSSLTLNLPQGAATYLYAAGNGDCAFSSLSFAADTPSSLFTTAIGSSSSNSATVSSNECSYSLAISGIALGVGQSAGSHSVFIQVQSPSGPLVTDATVTFNGASEVSGLSGTAVFHPPISGTFQFTVSAPGYQTYSGSIAVDAYYNAATVTLQPGGQGVPSLPPPSLFTSSGATESQSGGLTAVSAPFTYSGDSSATVNVWFVWYNATSDQVVNVGQQLGVTFSPGQMIGFSNAYAVPGTYTVHVFVTDANSNALSPTYPVSVIIP